MIILKLANYKPIVKILNLWYLNVHDSLMFTYDEQYFHIYESPRINGSYYSIEFMDCDVYIKVPITSIEYEKIKNIVPDPKMGLFSFSD